MRLMSSVTFSLTFPSSFRFSFRKGALLTFSVTFVPKAGCSSLLSDGRLGAATTVEGSVESTALRMTYTVHHGSCLCLCRSRQKVRVLFVFLQEAHTFGRGCQYKSLNKLDLTIFVWLTWSLWVKIVFHTIWLPLDHTNCQRFVYIFPFWVSAWFVKSDTNVCRSPRLCSM